MNAIEQLRQLKNESRAARDRGYHKSVREHWGISVPDCDRIARAVAKGLPEEKIFETAQALWDTDVFDAMVCAVKMLGLPMLKPSDALWGRMLSFLEQVDGWALEDGLASVAWRCILADERRLDVLEEWTKHKNFWMRRAALVYTLPFAKPGRNPERSLRWASLYASDSEWFIQKAIGWWLRVLGEHDPERVVAFLKVHWQHLKGVARHEATRKLDQTWRAEIITCVQVG